MKLTIERSSIERHAGANDLFINGVLYVDMVRFCLTAEPCDDNDGNGVLPEGTYCAVLSYLHEDEKVLPELVTDSADVRPRLYGRKSTAKESAFLGRLKGRSGLIPCEDTVNRVVRIMQSAEDVGESIFIEIKKRNLKNQGGWVACQ